MKTLFLLFIGCCLSGIMNGQVTQYKYTVDLTEKFRVLTGFHLRDGQEIQTFKLTHFISKKQPDYLSSNVKKKKILINKGREFKKPVLRQLKRARLGETYIFDEITIKDKWNPDTTIILSNKVIINVVTDKIALPVEPSTEPKSLTDIYPEIKNDTMEVVSYATYITRPHQDVIEIQNAGNEFDDMLARFFTNPKERDIITFVNIRLRGPSGTIYYVRINKQLEFE